jgi:putative endonuclease
MNGAKGSAIARAGRSRRGRKADLSGRAAEDSVERRYARGGLSVAARRWRGQGGEIDLVMREGEGLVFVEVKQAKSFAAAAERLTRRQIDRIVAAASEFLAAMPAGQLTPVRFDLALVDATGRVEVREGAFTA